MQDHKAWYVAAFKRDLVSEPAFRDLRDTFFRDPELSAEDQKEILSAVTGAPAQHLGSHRNRLQELETWRVRELSVEPAYPRRAAAGSGY